MQLKRKKRFVGEIDLSAFSDIAFLLIIFFILTTTFVRPAGRKMEIPSGSSQPSEAEQKQMAIDLRQNEIRIGEEPASLSLDELRARLVAANLPAQPEARRMILLQSHKDVPYDRYFKVVTAISQAGGVLALLDESEQ